MNSLLRMHAESIARKAIAACDPGKAVRDALTGRMFPGRVYIVSAGKAAWSMANAAAEKLGERLTHGIVITKYGHVKAPIARIDCFEACHPIPDENGINATKEALRLTEKLDSEDTVLFLLSGGASALFEVPEISLDELQTINAHLLKSGCDIKQINTIRKRLSRVKGGRFAEWCRPAHVESLILSDVVGDPTDMIASGPTIADSSTCAEALAIAEGCRLPLSPEARSLLNIETPKALPTASVKVIGNVTLLCRAAEEACRELGYEAHILTLSLDGEACEAGRALAQTLVSYRGHKPVAFIMGGETVVKVTGKGLGGRNQELALSAAQCLSGHDGAAVISVGSDGTDGPTDAAGGYADGDTLKELEEKGISAREYLKNNDSYHALKAVGNLIITGATGTNVNDVAIGLIR